MRQDELKLVLEALEYWDVHGKLHQPTEEAITAIKEALEKEKTLQALHSENERLGLYKEAYAQRTWVGLTDVEIDYLLVSTAGENEETHISFARAIEAKLKELNDISI